MISKRSVGTRLVIIRLDKHATLEQKSSGRHHGQKFINST